MRTWIPEAYVRGSHTTIFSSSFRLRSGISARTTYTYHKAQGTSDAHVVVRQIANSGSAVRTDAEYHIDPFGRLAVE